MLRCIFSIRNGINKFPAIHVGHTNINQNQIKNYPTDALQALLCDEVLDAVEDVNVKLGTTFGLTGDALKEARTTFVTGPLPLYLRWLQTQLQAHGGNYFADGRLTIADLKVFSFVQGINSGHLDHVPTDLVESVAPRLNAHQKRVAQTPAVAQYYAK